MTSSHALSVDRVAGALKNEIEETILKEKSDDVLREILPTQVSKKWTVCKTMPFIHCHHITEKSLKVKLGKEWGIGNNWILLKRHFTKW